MCLLCFPLGSNRLTYGYFSHRWHTHTHIYPNKHQTTCYWQMLIAFVHSDLLHAHIKEKTCSKPAKDVTHCWLLCVSHMHQPSGVQQSAVVASCLGWVLVHVDCWVMESNIPPHMPHVCFSYNRRWPQTAISITLPDSDIPSFTVWNVKCSQQHIVLSTHPPQSICCEHFCGAVLLPCQQPFLCGSHSTKAKRSKTKAFVNHR